MFVQLRREAELQRVERQQMTRRMMQYSHVQLLLSAVSCSAVYSL